MSTSPTTAPAAPKGSKLKWVVLGLVLILLLPVLVLGGLRLYYNDNYIKGEIEKTLAEKLGRDCKIGALELSILGGTAALENITIPNKEGGFESLETLKVGKISVTGAFVSLALNKGTEVEGLKVEIVKPEFIVERLLKDGKEVTNLDDIFEKFSSGAQGTWPKATGLKKLNVELSVREGVVRFRDKARGLGESRAESITFTATQHSLGEKLAGKLGLKLITPQTPTGGSLDADLALTWIDAQGNIPHPAQLKDLSFDSKLNNLDAPFLTRHFGLHVLVMDKKLETTLGQAVTGTLKLDAPELSKAALKADLETPGLISLWEKGVLKAGQLAAHISVEGGGGFDLDKGALRLEKMKAHLDLGPTPASLGAAAGAKGMDLDVDFAGQAGKPPVIAVKTQCNLEQLFSTDIGAALQLKDRVGGKLAIDGTSSADAQGRWHSAGKLTTDQAYVIVENVKQPTSVEVNFDTAIALDKDGNPDKGEATLACKANAFSVNTDGPLQLAGLNDASKLNLQGKLKFQVHGRELWKEFGPMLAIANLGSPLEEDFEGSATIAGTPGKLKADLEAVLSRQVEPKQEMRLSGGVSYDGDALVAAAGKPYLEFNVQVKSARDKSLSFSAAGTSTRFKDRMETDVPAQQFMGTLEALKALAKRFNAYVGVLPEGGLTLSGSAQMTAHTKIVRRLDAQGQETGRDLNTSAELKLFQFDLQAPPLAPGKPPVRWQEAEASLTAELAQHTEGAKALLTVPRLKLASGTLDLDASFEDADVGLLSLALSKRPFAPRDVLQAMPKAALKAQAAPECLARLQALGLIPDDPAAKGAVNLEATFDAKDRVLRVGAAGFKGDAFEVVLQPQAIQATSLLALVEGSMAGMDKLRAALPGNLPDMQVGLKVFAGALDALRRFKLLPQDLALKGEGSATVRYDGNGDRLFLDGIEFTQTKDAHSPLRRFSLTGEIAQASQLALSPPANAAELLQHFDKGLHLTQLDVDPAPLLKFLQSLKVGGEMLNEAAVGVYAVESLSVQDATVRRGEKPGTLLLTLNAQSDFSFHPRVAVGQAPSRDAESGLKGAWGTAPGAPLKVNLNPGQFAAEGALVFDQARLFCSAARPYVYDKAAGQECRVTFNAKQAADGTLTLDAAEISGGPFAVRVSGFSYKDQGGKAALALASADMTAPLALSLRGLALNAAADRLKVTVSGPKLEWAQLSPYLALPPSFQVGGTAENVQIDFDGRLSGLTKAFGPQDKFTFRADLKDVSLQGNLPGEPVKWLLNGPLVADGYTFASKRLSADLVYSAPGRATLRQQIALSVQMTGKKGLPLLDALKADGLPLAITTPVESRTTFDLEGVLDAIGALASAASSGGAGSSSSSSAGLAGIRNLRLEIPIISVPKLLLYGFLLEDLKVPGDPAQQKPGVTLDGLVVEIPTAASHLYGTTVRISNGRYDLSKLPGPILHSQDVETDGGIDIAGLVAAQKPPGKDDYQIGGKVKLKGTLAGAGFEAGQRRSWTGTFAADLTGLNARKPPKGKTSVFDDFLGGAKKEGIGLLGGILGGRTGETAGRLYKNDFGLNLNDFTFEALTVKATMRNGVAAVERATLVAMGDNKGLKVPFEGKLDAATETFAPQFTLWPAEIPASTQQLLNLDKLYEKDRAAILKDFADGKLKVVLTGALNNPKDNRIDLAAQFDALTARIDKMQADKAAADRAAQQAKENPPLAPKPPAPAPNPPPAQNPPPAKNPPPPASNPPPPAPNPPPPK
ncbi:MAG: hypothetical protein HY291_09975 [Planctomycetes bacterium]|nr:hypothetical protein [Planctomycetota bacterium]